MEESERALRDRIRALALTYKDGYLGKAILGLLECEHEPDFSTAQLCSSDPSIVDVLCAVCGCSGSYTADTRKESVQW